MPESLEETQVRLKPYVEKFEGLIRKALGEYTTAYAELRHRHSKRSQASLINDLIVAGFLETFGDTREARGDVALHSKGNSKLVIVQNGRYQLKLKKLDAKLRARFIPTEAAMRFVWQQLSFEQVPAPTNLHMGYQVVDDASLTSSKVWITCPDGNEVGWQWELDLAQRKADDQKKVADIHHIAPAETGKKKRVSLKKNASDATRKKSDDAADGSQ